MKKNLGQNFLSDNNIKKNIFNHINIKKKNIIIELGAGAGALSENISSLSDNSFFIEIDKELIPSIKKKIKLHFKKSKLYNDDILKFNLKDLIKKYKKVRIIGSIPYKITSKILNLIEIFSDGIEDVHLIIQKEVAEKLINSKKENYLKLILNYKFVIKKIFDIKPLCFKPPPKVISTFISLKPKKNKKYISDVELLKKIIRISFDKKRKTMKNAIKNINKIKQYIHIDRRPEDTTITDFIRISNFLSVIKSS